MPLTFQMVLGLKALHDIDVFHRDIKVNTLYSVRKRVPQPWSPSENRWHGTLFINRTSRKSQKKDCFTLRPEPRTTRGNFPYHSPEVWKDQPYNHKSDIWSLGCVLYELTALKPPFRADDMEGLYKKIVKGTYPKIPNTYSPDLNLVIKTLLQVQPNARPNCGSPKPKILCLNRLDLPAVTAIETPRKNQHPQSRRRHVPNAPDHSSPQKSLLFNRKTT